MAVANPYPPGFEPFVAAMQADIDADLPRLAFADWLDDHGDPDRAEFIRLSAGSPAGTAAGFRTPSTTSAICWKSGTDRWLTGWRSCSRRTASRG